jgi:hypothetical protein
VLVRRFVEEVNVYVMLCAGGIIKQADAVLLGFPLEVTFGNMTPEVRLNDLTYYEYDTFFPCLCPRLSTMKCGDIAFLFSSLVSHAQCGDLLPQSPFATGTERTRTARP